MTGGLEQRWSNSTWFIVRNRLHGGSGGGASAGIFRAYHNVKKRQFWLALQCRLHHSVKVCISGFIMMHPAGIVVRHRVARKIRMYIFYIGDMVIIIGL